MTLNTFGSKSSFAPSDARDQAALGRNRFYGMTDDQLSSLSKRQIKFFEDLSNKQKESYIESPSDEVNYDYVLDASWMINLLQERGIISKNVKVPFDDPKRRLLDPLDSVHNISLVSGVDPLA